MRVYGSSPLYNWVELVFRSKRLFIVSIILATLVMVGVSTLKAGSYTATALVLLSGSPTAISNSQEENSSQRGSVKFKLSILNLLMKDPNFFKEAFKAANLDRGLSEPDFDKFIKEVRNNLKAATGDNVLELSIRWPDDRAAKIIDAFYDAYSRNVLEQETVISSNQTKLLKSMVADYTAKVRELEAKVIAQRKKAVDQQMLDPNTATQLVYNRREAVRATENELQKAERGLAYVTAQLSNIKPTIQGQVLIEGIQRSPQYQELERAETEYQNQLAEAKLKYNDVHPIVRRLEGILKEVQSRKAALEGKRPSGNTNRVIEEPNPEYIQLSAQRTNLEMSVESLKSQLAATKDALAEARAQANQAPELVSRMKWMLDKSTLYETIRNNLNARLEQAIMDEKKDREMRIAEMTMMVRPESELETVGKRNILFYVAGPLLGVIIAFAFSLVAETLDHSLRTPVEVEKYLGKPVLAVLPRMDAPRGADKPRLTGGSDSAMPSLPS